jgi:hypothetical protein
MGAATLRLRVLEIAQAEVGTREDGKNSGLRVRAYQRATWLEPGPWPWCAAFVSWCLMQAIGPQTKHEGKWRCRDARAYGWEDWAAKRGITMLDETADLLPGDIITFDFSHIGIVESDEGQKVVTIEGNTNAEGSREGDGVYRKVRARHLIRKVIRLPDQAGA